MRKHFLEGSKIYDLRHQGRRSAVLFLTATSIGLLAGMTRSLASIIAAALLIPVVFLVAALFGATSMLGLLVAILGFNFGLINLILATAAIQSVRHA
jgi:hypothetical protein